MSIAYVFLSSFRNKILKQIAGMFSWDNFVNIYYENNIFYLQLAKKHQNFLCLEIHTFVLDTYLQMHIGSVVTTIRTALPKTKVMSLYKQCFSS